MLKRSTKLDFDFHFVRIVVVVFFLEKMHLQI